MGRLVSLIPLPRDALEFLLTKDYSSSIQAQPNLLVSLAPDAQVKLLTADAKAFDLIVRYCW